MYRHSTRFPSKKKAFISTWRGWMGIRQAGCRLQCLFGKFSYFNMFNVKNTYRNIRTLTSLEHAQPAPSNAPTPADAGLIHPFTYHHSPSQMYFPETNLLLTRDNRYPLPTSSNSIPDSVAPSQLN